MSIYMLRLCCKLIAIIELRKDIDHKILYNKLHQVPKYQLHSHVQSMIHFNLY